MSLAITLITVTTFVLHLFLLFVVSISIHTQLHRLVHFSSAFRQLHLFVEHRVLMQPHFTSCMMASGAGGRDVVTGTHFSSCDFQPNVSGDGSCGSGTVSKFHTNA